MRKKALSLMTSVNRLVAWLSDSGWILFCLWFSYQLFGNFRPQPLPLPPELAHTFWHPVANAGIAPAMATLVVAVEMAMFLLFGLYRGIWRFASIPDLMRIIKAVAVSALVITSAVYFLELAPVPRAILILNPLLLILGLGGSRFLYRWGKEQLLGRHNGGERSQHVMVVGAGHAGELLVRDLNRHPEYRIVGFVDDDVRKKGTTIHGIRVLGTIDDLARLLADRNVDMVLLAIAAPQRDKIRAVVNVCADAKVECRTLPSLRELADGRVEISRLRPIMVEDLLGRSAVRLDMAAITILNDRVVMVTGGGGSIGAEACRQVARQHPACLVIFEHSEFNLYQIEQEIRREFPTLWVEAVLGDVKNVERVQLIFERFRPQVVIHAAAYKHVPLVEGNPAEGVRNNVWGTIVMADMADRFGCERFVLISTDKAVRPTNVMGTSKRIAEIYCQNLNELSKTRFITVRFGNVLASTGSVVPLFQQQIASGGPVTVTHPEITRFFMTIPEAVSLVLQAGAIGRGGEIFVLDMGEPVSIRELAEQMIRLSGLEPNVDIAIEYTGLRPGEKLYEELFHEDEGLQKTPHQKLLLAQSRRVEWEQFKQELAQLDVAARQRNIVVLYEQLRKLVPEFMPQVPMTKEALNPAVEG